ncbi:hypothetical protein ABPS01_00860 [Streptococcus sp. ZJ151]|uniref:hypothetical protein n=1 Tax=Streptococcus jiangjianxini TaxID=3161189 RepID=UPI0032EFC450
MDDKKAPEGADNILPEIIEYNDALFIDNQKIPYVVKDSIFFDSEDDIISISIVARSYQRIFENYSNKSQEFYSYKENLPD